MTEKQVLDVFAALSQTTRLKVFRILVENSKDGICPCDIAEKLKIPRNTLSFHLSWLSKANLCSTEKKGKTIIYRSNCKEIQKVSDYLLQNCCSLKCSGRSAEKIIKKIK